MAATASVFRHRWSDMLASPDKLCASDGRAIGRRHANDDENRAGVYGSGVEPARRTRVAGTSAPIGIYRWWRAMLKAALVARISAEFADWIWRATFLRIGVGVIRMEQSFN